VVPFPGSYPTNPPLCHSRARVVPELTIVEQPHSQQGTVEDADEIDEEQEEDEEDMEGSLPWTHSPVIKQAAWASKQYRGHRVLPETIMAELETAKLI